MPISTEFHLLESPTGSTSKLSKTADNSTKSESLCRKLGIDYLVRINDKNDAHYLETCFFN